MSSRSPHDGADSPSGKGKATSRDWRGVGDLIDLATERLTAPVEGMHDAIADRWFGLAGPRAVPLRKAYRAVTSPIYRSVRLTGSALGTAVGLGAIAVASRKELRPLWHSPRGSGIQAVVNAVWGDELESRSSSMSIDMGLRDVAGVVIGLDPTSLALAFPERSSRLVILVHGLGETERCWQGPTAEDGSATGLADTLASGSFSPLLARYNTGRHVSDNGVGLAALLDAITRAWPVPVEEVALVGHSMGGLVARSAVHAGREAGHDWVGALRHVVALGSPHLGSPIEKGANVVSWGLGLVPEGRPLGEFLNHRSAGIKDLRFGAVVEGDWSEGDLDGLLTDPVRDLPLPEGVEQHFVAGVITSEPTHPLGALVGDLIVRVGSGTGRGRRRRVEATDVRVVGGKGHPDLVHDPTVHQQVLVWLASDNAYEPSK